LNDTRFSEGRQYVEDHELPGCPDIWSSGKLRTLLRTSSFRHHNDRALIEDDQRHDWTDF
jgi:hypothetical protein